MFEIEEVYESQDENESSESDVSQEQEQPILQEDPGGREDENKVLLQERSGRERFYLDWFHIKSQWKRYERGVIGCVALCELFCLKIMITPIYRH